MRSVIASNDAFHTSVHILLYKAVMIAGGGEELKTDSHSGEKKTPSCLNQKDNLHREDSLEYFGVGGRAGYSIS